MPKQKPGRSKQDYRTPPEFIAAVKKRLGIDSFTVDLAANDENTLAPWYFTESTNALNADSWAFRIGSGWNWLNPPFDNIAKFARKAAEEWVANSARTAMLVPASVGANWWRDWVHGFPDVEVLFLNGRITFVGCDDPYPKDCALILYGQPYERQYDVWSWTRE